MGQNRNIIVRVIGDIRTSSLGVFLTKIIGSMKITTLILHSAPTSHGRALMESMKLSTLTAPFTLYYCYFPSNVDIEKIHKMENSEHILKQRNYAHSVHTIDDSIILEPEAFPLLDACNLEKDTLNFLNRSSPQESEFLRCLINNYLPAVSQGPSHIGKIKREEFKLDIVLENENSKLPLDLPYPTSAIKKIVCACVVNSWKKSGIVEKSSTVTHGIRLTVETKHLPASDFKDVQLRLKNDHNIEMENRDSLFKINPEILAESELNKSYRICADARNLNSLTKPEFTCSLSPESVLVELISLSSEHQSLLNVDDCSIPQALKKYFLEDDKNDNNLYFSSIDIKSAHNSLVLTDNASHILNAILPDYSTVRFLRSPFGLRNVNSCFNRTLSTIPKTLIQKRLIVVYADDLLEYSTDYLIY